VSLKKMAKAQQQLHLVTPEEAAAVSPPLSPGEEDTFIAKAVRRYQQLQEEFESEFLGERDLDKIGVMLPEIRALRGVLVGYGVRVLR